MLSRTSFAVLRRTSARFYGRSNFVSRGFSKIVDRHSDCLETILASAGCYQSDPLTGAVVPPLYLSTAYERDEELMLSRGFNYSRTSNPSRLAFETAMAEIEGGSECLAFSSGMQAAVALFMACPKAHVILPVDLYYGIHAVLVEVFQQWGVTFEKIDMTDHHKVVECLEKVKKSFSKDGNERKLIFWIETPSNPVCKVSDIAKLSALVRERFSQNQGVVVVDATWSTPFLTKPLSLGADVVLHSTTKYIGGHNDTLGGCLVLAHHPPAPTPVVTTPLPADESNVIVSSHNPAQQVQEPVVASSLSERLRHVHQIGGGVMSAFDSWLAVRGLRTLHVRMRQHCENAFMVAEYLTGHKSVQQVFYPGLISHPQHKLATAQMGGKYYGGMLSFLVKGSSPAAAEANALQVKWILKNVLYLCFWYYSFLSYSIFRW